MIPDCVEPDAPWEICVNCGAMVKTCERKEPIGHGDYTCPAHPDGCEGSDGRWTCSEKCYDELERKNDARN